MQRLTVALLQLVATGSQEGNQAKGIEACRKAAAMGADIALFPEMWNTGYAGFDGKNPAERERWLGLAVTPDSPFVTTFRNLAHELDMAIAITYAEKFPGLPRNTVSLFDRHGNNPLNYSKIHTCDFDCMEASTTPGDDWYVCDLDTRAGSVKVGALICYDREFPESSRILMLKGAEVVLTPNACHLDEPKLIQYRTRAYENCMCYAMANYGSPNGCNGHSIACDQYANIAVEAGELEGIYPATFDLETLRKQQRGTIWGNAFRRPHRYGLLTSMEVEPKFVRNNAFGDSFDRARR